MCIHIFFKTGHSCFNFLGQVSHHSEIIEDFLIDSFIFTEQDEIVRFAEIFLPKLPEGCDLLSHEFRVEFLLKNTRP